MTDREANSRSLAQTGIFYSLIGMGDAIIWEVINSWQNYYYFPPDGVALIPVGFLYGLLMTLNALIDIAVKLPIGHWSDRTRTRWGRRLPFMFVAGLPRLLLFILIWTPPHQSKSTLNLYYLAAILIIHNVVASFQHVPNEALLPELGQTDQERVKLSAWAGILPPVGLMIGSFAGIGIEHWGYLPTVMIYALLTLPLFYLPFLVLRERPDSKIDTRKQFSMRESFQLIRKNRPFLVYTTANTLSMSGQTLIHSMFPFIVTELLLLTPGDTVYFYVAGLATTLLVYLTATRLTKRWGKRRVFYANLLISILVGPMLLLFGEWMSIPRIIPGLIWAAILGLTTGGATVLKAAFMGEIIEYDAQLTGQRREGAYYAALDFINEIMYNTVAIILPVLLVLGRDATGPRGPLGIKIAGVLGGLAALTALIIFQSYRVPTINRERAAIS
ncbi:MAG: MFS transporter [Anaerolineales bacterium]